MRNAWIVVLSAGILPAGVAAQAPITAAPRNDAAATAGTAQGPAPAKASVNSATDPNAEKARQLLNQCIAALGGQAWRNVNDMSQEGRTYGYQHGSPTGFGTVFWRFWKFPDKERVELTKQRDVVYIHNGDKGYEITFKGTAEEEPHSTQDFVRRREHSLEIVLRRWLTDPKTALFYDGAAVAEQKPADSVTLLNASNDSVTLFLDRTTHLPIKSQFEFRAPDRVKDTEGEVYDAWRPEQGVMTAHSVLRVKNGEIVSQRFIASVKYNTGLADTMFEAKVTYAPVRPAVPD